MATLVEENVEALRARTRREIDDGLLPSCQIALALDGEVVVHETFGDADDTTRYVIFSATKPVVASTAWTLIQDGHLDVSRPVIDYFPEFMRDEERRGDVTVEQVMLHTSGFPHAPLGPPAWLTREGRLERMARWRLNWAPGSQFEYHPTSAHWVLAEIIERLAGDDYRRVIRERVLDPHGLTRLRVGVPESEQDDIAGIASVGEPATPDELEAALGIRELPATEVTDDALLRFNTPSTRAVGVPGGGGVSDAADLARFYQALLHNPAGVWDADLLTDVTSRVRNTFRDPMGGYPVRRTLGLCLAGDDEFKGHRGFGHTSSPGTFGHLGAGGQIGWADPATGLSFAYLTNGIDANAIRQGRHCVSVSSVAATCATA